MLAPIVQYQQQGPVLGRFSSYCIQGLACRSSKSDLGTIDVEIEHIFLSASYGQQHDRPNMVTKDQTRKVRLDIELFSQHSRYQSITERGLVDTTDLDRCLVLIRTWSSALLF